MPTFKDMADIKAGEWQRKVHSQYAMAYNTAHEEYAKTAARQDATDKAQGEFFAAVVSVMSCSVALSVMARISLPKIAMRVGIRSIGVVNTREMMKFIQTGRQHPGVAFAFGKAYDSVQGAAGDKFKQIAASLVQELGRGLTAVSPHNRTLQLSNILTAKRDHAIRMAWEIEANRGLGVSQKATAMRDLYQSPFMNPPSNAIDQEALAKKIELAFYMNKVLEGDYILTHFPIEMRTPAVRSNGVDALPSQGHYPKNQSPHGRPGATWNTVEYERPGMDFQSKIDELHKAVYKKPFYEAGYVRRLLPGGDRRELVKAEAVLNQLSFDTRPKGSGIVAF